MKTSLRFLAIAALVSGQCVRAPSVQLARTKNRAALTAGEGKSMKGRSCGKRVTRRLLTSLLGAAACCAVAARPAFPGEGQPVPSGPTQTGSGTSISQPPVASPAAAPAGASGMRVYVDPRTGAFLKEPAPGHVPHELSPQL